MRWLFFLLFFPRAHDSPVLSCLGLGFQLPGDFGFKGWGVSAYHRSSVTGIFRLWCSSQWHPGQTITVLSWPLSSYSDSARSGLCRISFLWWTIATGRRSFASRFFSHGFRSGVSTAGTFCSHSWHRHGFDFNSRSLKCFQCFEL